MWRTSQNPWVQLLAPGTAHASAAGALSFVGVGVSGVAYLMKMPGLGRLGQGVIRKYETSTATNTQLIQDLWKETRTPGEEDGGQNGSRLPTRRLSKFAHCLSVTK